jgi:hypothetical protein
MSRELKLKAWDKIKSEMCDVMGIDFIQNMVLCFPITKKTARAGKWRPLDEFELIQFAGAKEFDESVAPRTHGKMIYEGDICFVYADFYGDEVKRKVIVEKIGNAFYFNYTGKCFTTSDWTQYHKIEIIGNIYENSELGVGEG